jgi:hypothetical protein
MSSRRRKKNLNNKTSIGTIAACSGAVGLFVGLSAGVWMNYTGQKPVNIIDTTSPGVDSDHIDDSASDAKLRRKIEKIYNETLKGYDEPRQMMIRSTLPTACCFNLFRGKERDDVKMGAYIKERMESRIKNV